MMKQVHKITSAATLLTVAILATGCATTPAWVQQDVMKLENIDSSSVHIIRTYLQTGEEGVVLRGELARRIPARGPIPGHLHVELLGPDGKVMKEAEIDHLQKSVKSLHAEFSLLIPPPLIPGGTVRVKHHDAKSHMPHPSASPWQDANTFEINKD